MQWEELGLLMELSQNFSTKYIQGMKTLSKLNIEIKHYIAKNSKGKEMVHLLVLDFSGPKKLVYFSGPFSL